MLPIGVTDTKDFIQKQSKDWKYMVKFIGIGDNPLMQIRIETYLNEELEGNFEIRPGDIALHRNYGFLFLFIDREDVAFYFKLKGWEVKER